ncbi:hypothetical protein Anapl_17090 [Anas platyrhynchos]|uniref:Uncharacterized protein n=1 Tax=Anas platyrhynchos TaxID=8839 RepID=R0L0M8_ANAPL|nr:hypothetical protein Anapl_17090 [Anas platyrhynchos]
MPILACITENRSNRHALIRHKAKCNQELEYRGREKQTAEKEHKCIQKMHSGLQHQATTASQQQLVGHDQASADQFQWKTNCMMAPMRLASQGPRELLGEKLPNWRIITSHVKMKGSTFLQALGTNRKPTRENYLLVSVQATTSQVQSMRPQQVNTRASPLLFPLMTHLSHCLCTSSGVHQAASRCKTRDKQSSLSTACYLRPKSQEHSKRLRTYTLQTEDSITPRQPSRTQTCNVHNSFSSPTLRTQQKVLREKQLDCQGQFASTINSILRLEPAPSQPASTTNTSLLLPLRELYEHIQNKMRCTTGH